MFAIDTNLLVYAHNTDSEFYKQAAEFNGIAGLYTVNVGDFKTFDFLKAVNPLQTLSNQTDLSDTDSESDEGTSR